MEDQILKELERIKDITLLGVKTALTMEDAALFTGLSKKYLYILVSSKQIPHYKSGGGKMTYFDKSELTQWLLSRRIKTTDEIDQEATSICLYGRNKNAPTKRGK